jgi:hypothetical protein
MTAVVMMSETPTKTMVVQMSCFQETTWESLQFIPKWIQHQYAHIGSFHLEGCVTVIHNADHTFGSVSLATDLGTNEGPRANQRR